MKGQTYTILAILFVIIVAIFAVLNVEPVVVNYVFWTGESPLIFVILFSVLMGGMITAAVGSLRIFKLQRHLKKLTSENNHLKLLVEEGNEREEKTSPNEES